MFPHHPFNPYRPLLPPHLFSQRTPYHYSTSHTYPSAYRHSSHRHKHRHHSIHHRYADPFAFDKHDASSPSPSPSSPSSHTSDSYYLDTDDSLDTLSLRPKKSQYRGHKHPHPHKHRGQLGHEHHQNHHKYQHPPPPPASPSSLISTFPSISLRLPPHHPPLQQSSILILPSKLTYLNVSISLHQHHHFPTSNDTKSLETLHVAVAGDIWLHEVVKQILPAEWARDTRRDVKVLVWASREWVEVPARGLVGDVSGVVRDGEEVRIKVVLRGVGEGK